MHKVTDQDNPGKSRPNIYFRIEVESVNTHKYLGISAPTKLDFILDLTP